MAIDWNAYTEFDKFIADVNRIRVMTFDTNPNEWMNAKCTCPSYMKHFMCKHVVAVAFRLKILTPVENDPDDEPLKPNKARGRPKKVPKGLTKGTCINLWSFK